MVMGALKILPAGGEGDRAKRGGEGLRSAATLLESASPLHQALRACHLPMNGEDFA
jgi:hypothetical protein